MSSENMNTMLKNYLPSRFKQVPFPVESLCFWLYLFDIQNFLDVSGDILEIGVENGGTAFLLAQHLKPNEFLDLVDLSFNENFCLIFDKQPIALKSRISLHELNSKNMLPIVQDKCFKFIHIDGSHTYDGVKADINIATQSLSKNGILCVDDFFSPRWPDVTSAVLDTYESVGLVPLFLVNRKVYFGNSPFSNEYTDLVVRNIKNLEQFGDVKCIFTTLKANKVLTFKTNFKLS